VDFSFFLGPKTMGNFVASWADRLAIGFWGPAEPIGIALEQQWKTHHLQMMKTKPFI